MLPISDKEDKAVLALIAGTLHPYAGEVTEEEIESVLASGRTLSAEGRMALEGLGDDPFASMDRTKDRPPAASEAGQLAAMHREAVSAELDDETRAKLEEKRQEVLERIRNRNKDTPPQ
jgi:hypothetical protein